MEISPIINKYQHEIKKCSPLQTVIIISKNCGFNRINTKSNGRDDDEIYVNVVNAIRV